MVIKGILNFYGWNHPWFIYTSLTEKQNLYPHIEKFFTLLTKREATFVEESEGFKLHFDEKSTNRFKYEKIKDGVVAIFSPKKGVGSGKNIVNHISDVLERINGRKATFSFIDHTIEITADTDEEVFNLYHKNELPTPIKEDVAQNICNASNNEKKCIFCIKTANTGFECSKATSAGSKALLIAMEKTFKPNNGSGRIGNCLVIKSK